LSAVRQPGETVTGWPDGWDGKGCEMSAMGFLFLSPEPAFLTGGRSELVIQTTSLGWLRSNTVFLYEFLLLKDLPCDASYPGTRSA
jgi:hypothetical protein